MGSSREIAVTRTRLFPNHYRAPQARAPHTGESSRRAEDATTGMSPRASRKVPVSALYLPRRSQPTDVHPPPPTPPTAHISASTARNATVARRPTPLRPKCGRCGLDGLLADGIAVPLAHQQCALDHACGAWPPRPSAHALDVLCRPRHLAPSTPSRPQGHGSTAARGVAWGAAALKKVRQSSCPRDAPMVLDEMAVPFVHSQ